MEEVERVRYKAALAVTGAWQGTNRPKLYDELGWEPLSYRRLSNCLLSMLKIVTKITPSYLRDKLLPEAIVFSGDAIALFCEYRVRITERFARSYFPDTTKWWNNIMPQFRF